MTNKIVHILHIGLPKTATSTLQKHYFPLATSHSYIGINQPRALTRNTLCNAIGKAVSSPEVSERSANQAKAKRLLDRSRESILFSEEMVLVNGYRIWTEKLVELHAIFKDYPYEILLTIRNPWICAFSLFVEIYHDKFNTCHEFYKFWDECSQAQIFRYRTLVTTVQQIFEGRPIHVAAFEHFTKNPSALFREIGVELASMPDFRKLNENSKRKAEEGIYTNPGSDRIRDLIVQRMSQNEFPGQKLVRKLSKNMIRGRLNFRVSKPSVLIPYPDFERAIAESQPHLTWLDREYGIKLR